MPRVTVHATSDSLFLEVQAESGNVSAVFRGNSSPRLARQTVLTAAMALIPRRPGRCQTVHVSAAPQAPRHSQEAMQQVGAHATQGTRVLMEGFVQDVITGNSRLLLVQQAVLAVCLANTRHQAPAHALVVPQALILRPKARG